MTLQEICGITGKAIDVEKFEKTTVAHVVHVLRHPAGMMAVHDVVIFDDKATWSRRLPAAKAKQVFQKMAGLRWP